MYFKWVKSEMCTFSGLDYIRVIVIGRASGRYRWYWVWCGWSAGGGQAQTGADRRIQVVGAGMGIGQEWIGVRVDRLGVRAR